MNFSRSALVGPPKQIRSSSRRCMTWTSFAAAWLLSTLGVRAADITEKDLVGYTFEFQSNYRASFSRNNVSVTQDRQNTYTVTFLDAEQASVRLTITIHPVGAGADTVENRSGIFKIGEGPGDACDPGDHGRVRRRDASLDERVGARCKSGEGRRSSTRRRLHMLGD